MLSGESWGAVVSQPDGAVRSEQSRSASEARVACQMRTTRAEHSKRTTTLPGGQVKNPLAAHPPWRQMLIVSLVLPLLIILAVLAFAWPAARIQPRNVPLGVVG